jgi:hypothetical protein
MTVDDLLTKAADCEARGKWLAADYYFRWAMEIEWKAESEGMK